MVTLAALILYSKSTESQGASTLLINWVPQPWFPVTRTAGMPGPFQAPFWVSNLVSSRRKPEHSWHGSLLQGLLQAKNTKYMVPNWAPLAWDRLLTWCQQALCPQRQVHTLKTCCRASNACLPLAPCSGNAAVVGCCTDFTFFFFSDCLTLLSLCKHKIF